MSLVSHHLSVLRQTGLVTAERDKDDGRWIHYSLDPAGLEDLTETLCRLLDAGKLQQRHTPCPTVHIESESPKEHSL